MGLALVNLGSKPQERLPRVTSSLRKPDLSHLLLLQLHLRRMLALYLPISFTSPY